MKSDRGKTGPVPPADASRTGRGCRVRMEWPLLAFPAAVLATLILLFIVDRSIKRETPISRGQRPTAPVESFAARTATSAGQTTQPTQESVTSTPGATPDRGRGGDAPDGDGYSTAAPTTDRTEMTRSATLAQEQPGRLVNLDGLQGSDLIVAILQNAVYENDQVKIKQCIDDLVALGDQVIAPLTRVISNESGEQGLWAAEALARIGTPLAATTLLDALSQIKEGPYKEELGRRVAGISNHESWPVLLDKALETADSTVLRAASGSLAQMADTPIVDELLARYDGAVEERDIERITQLISNIQSPKATDSLISLAGEVTSTPQDPLELAAVEALGKIGDPQAISYLMRKLEASPPGEGDYLFNTISQVNQPQAREALLYAAAGNKEVSAESGRVAAIYALQNFPDPETCALLEQIIAQEQNDRVTSAATRTLDNIHRTSPHAVANAHSLEKKDPSTDLVKK